MNDEITCYMSYDKYDDGMIILFLDPKTEREEFMLSVNNDSYVILDELSNKIIGVYFFDFDYKIKHQKEFFSGMKDIWIDRNLAKVFSRWTPVNRRIQNNMPNCKEFSSLWEEIPRKIERIYA